MHKITDDGREPWRLVILLLITPFWMHEMNGEVWYQLRLVILILKTLFPVQKPEMRAGTLETSNSDAKHAVLQAQSHRWGLGPMETCKSGAKVSVLHAKTTDEGWDSYRLVILVLTTLFCMQKSTGEVCDP